jgi:hypothetical protein
MSSSARNSRRQAQKTPESIKAVEITQPIARGKGIPSSFGLESLIFWFTK